MSNNWRAFLPTPKMASVLLWGAVGVLAVLAADFFDVADLRPAAAGFLVLLLAEAGGWVKDDSSYRPGFMRDDPDFSHRLGPVDSDR